MSDPKAPMNSSERRRARMQMKKTDKQKRAEEIVNIIATIRDVIDNTNRLIPSKIAKPIVLPDGEIFNKRYIRTTQLKMIEDVTLRLKELATTSTAPRPKNTDRINNYARPFYVRQKVIDWLRDPRVKFSAKDVAVHMNTEDLGDTTPYDGRELVDTLTMCRDLEILIESEDGGDDIAIATLGLTNKHILSDLLNLHMSQNKLKGVRVKNKNGEEKINNSYWRPDDAFMEYFGDCVNSIIEKENAKEKKPNGVEISRDCIPASMMSILASMTDVEKSKQFKKYMTDERVVQPIDTDRVLVNSIYSRFKK